MESKLKMNNKKTGKMVTKHFQLCDKKLISYKISVFLLEKRKKYLTIF